MQKTDMRRMVDFILAVFILFLIYRYWDAFIGLLLTMLTAAAPLFLGCGIAYVVNIPLRAYEKGYERIFHTVKWRRPICITVSFLSIFLILVILLSIVVPEFLGAMQILVQNVPAQLESLVNQLNENVQVQGFIKDLYEQYIGTAEKFQDMLTNFFSLFRTGASDAIGQVVGGVFSLFSNSVTVLVGFMFSLYILGSKEKLQSQFQKLLKSYLPKAYPTIAYVVTVLDDCFHNFVVGQVLEAVIIGVLCAIGMSILRFPYAFMIGALIGFTALIPVAGAYIGAIVGALMMLTVSPMTAVLFLVFIVVLQQIEGNLIYPRVVGSSIGLPGIWVLAAVTVGGGVLGFAGMLIGVPIAATIYKLLVNDVRAKAKT